MGEGFYFVDILIFGMVAAFLVYRLRSVLGKRHGEERQRPNPFGQRPPAASGASDRTGTAPDNVVTLPERGRSSDLGAADAGVDVGMDEVPPSDLPVSLEEGLKQIHAADPQFNERHFLQGARAAFDMIVKAFADGDTATLRPLLADDVYDNFAAAIRQRQETRQTLETTIQSVEAVDLTAARMDGRHARCTVKFVSHQINVTRDAAGQVIDGDPEQAEEVEDIWTFARNTRSTDPNWLLVETRTPH